MRFEALYSLISVHIPKTAGTSFAGVLRECFGEKLIVDNSDRPLSHPAGARKVIALKGMLSNIARSDLPECVHGHFLPVKFLAARRARFCTWFRDPVQRVISRYYHYVWHADVEKQHYRWGLRPGLSIEEFIRIPQYHNTYAKYLWAFPFSKFDFVGVVENGDCELKRFRDCFGFSDVSLNPIRVNVNPAQIAGAGYEIEPSLERLIRQFNARDVALYNRALDAQR